MGQGDFVLKITAKHYETYQPITIETGDGQIQSIASSTEEADLWISPTLLDIQINGFGGHSFNGEQVTSESVKEIVTHQWSLGIGAICPTVTTNSQERMLHSLRCIREACTDPLIANSILGIHIEGPYISPVDGPRGAHPLEHTRPPSWDEFCAWQDAAEGTICLLTLAPEVEGAIPFIEQLVDSGVIVALGHTNAEAEDIDAAVRAGARLSTHLGNGAHATIRRHPNYIWEQLARDELMASLIVDGHHLPPSVVKCMLRCKGLKNIILVSDAVSFAGMPPGRYETKERAVEVSADGRVSLADTPYLAGAGLDLASCVANAVQFTGISLADAICAACLHPATLLSRDDMLGSLEVGKRADFMLFDWNNERIEVKQMAVAGEIVYRTEKEAVL